MINCNMTKTQAYTIKKNKKKTTEAVNFLIPRAGSRSEDLETGCTDDHTVVHYEKTLKMKNY